MKLLTALSLPILINAALYSAEQKANGKCDFDHDTRAYHCRNIKGAFPKIFYGNYHLKCERCEIQTFQKDTFPHDNDLVSMNLTGVGMEIIGGNAFDALSTLQFIYLQHNKIKNISTDAFYGLRQVYELHLEHNEVSELTFHFLNGFEANTIVFSHNKLSEIQPDAFEGIFGVMALDLSHNFISKLHKDSFNHLHGLEYLHLQHNRLCSLPLGMFRHSGILKELNLAGNNIKKFNHGVFSGLSNLKLLNISNNDLMGFDPSALIPLSKLSRLDLSANGLNYLDSVPIHNNAPGLTEIGIKDNLWSCFTLVNLVQYFKGVDVEVSEHNRYEVTNVKGITCVERHMTYDKIPFKDFYKIAQDLTEAAVDFC